MYLHYVLDFLLFAMGVALGFYGVRFWERRRKTDAATKAVPSFAPSEEDEPVMDEDAECMEDANQTPPAEQLSESDLEFSRRLLDLIDQRLDQRNLQVDMLAREMAMSHTLFYARVHKVLGESPATLIRNHRLSRARDMLFEGSRSVAEVALLCGFSDAKYFSVVFKKRYGVSPSKI